jgi:glycosyltransferase involved in cell wall biosynthesis
MTNHRPMPVESGKMPLVSVVIPTYNCAQYLPETIQSILSQSWQDLEIIIVDDGSTDNTQEVVQGFDPKRVTYLYQANSGGPSRPRNKGIQQANGRYIALVDSDDILLPGKIERAVRMLVQEPQLGLVFTDFAKFDEVRGQYPGAFLDTYEYFRKLPKKQVGESEYVIDAASAYDGLISENYIGTSSVVMPKEVFSQIGLFDESLSGPEDFDMWLRITSRYDIGFIDMVGHRYRIRADSIMARGDRKLIPQLLRIMRKQFGKSPPDALRKKIHKRIARQLWALGYCHQTSEEMKLARKQYMLSLKEAHYWLAWKGLLMTFLGGRLIRLFKQFRDY